MKYMVSNASKNSKNGLDADKVVDLIVRIDGMRNPKPSYTVGRDAKFAEIVSRLPFDWQNKLVKFKLSRVMITK